MDLGTDSDVQAILEEKIVKAQLFIKTNADHWARPQVLAFLQPNIPITLKYSLLFRRLWVLYNASDSKTVSDLNKVITIGVAMLGSSASDESTQPINFPRSHLQKMEFRAQSLTMLSRALEARFDRVGHLGDLDEAICLRQNSIDLRPDGSIVPSWDDSEISLCRLLMKKVQTFMQTDLGLINEAISYGSTALQMMSINGAIGTPPASLLQKDAQDLQMVAMTALSLAFQHRFHLAQDYRDLDEAICLRQKNITLHPDGYETLAMDEIALCQLLTKKFNHSRTEISIITEAISYGRSSLERLNSSTAPDIRLVIMSQLAGALRSRFLYLATIDDDDASIALMHDALKVAVDAKLTPDKLALTQNNLATALHLKLRRRDANPTDTAGAADKCVELLLQAIVVSPRGSPDWAIRRHNLVCAFGSKFDALGDVADLDNAIELAQDTLEASPALSKRMQVSILDTVGICSFLRFKALRITQDLNKSIDRLDNTLSLAVSADCEDALLSLPVLIAALWERYRLQGSSHDLEKVVELLQKTASSASPSLKLRFHMLCISAHLACIQKRMDDAVDGFQAASDLLPRVLLLGKDYRTDVLVDSGGDDLSLTGAACSIACGKYNLAVEMLEQGRSIGWARSLQLRVDHTELAAHHPRLAERLLHLARRLELAEGSQMHSGGSETVLNRAARNAEAPWERAFALSQGWDELVSEIRALDGYDDFLRPLRYEKLAVAASKGPVIVVNISNQGCAALIITESSSDRPQVVPLAKALCYMVHDWSEDLRREMENLASNRTPEKVFNKALKRVLRGLWKEIVAPVVEALHSLAPYARRVWWCPTGRLTFLPLHMASENDKASPPFISSYAITLASLLHAQTSTPKPQSVSILAVSCAEAPGYSALPGTFKELQTLHDLLPKGSITHLGETEAQVDRVLAGLVDHPWIHFACHGEQVEKPYRSHLVLNDGKLYMSDIIARTLPNAEFAFLSACHTATGTHMLHDEAMHLAAGLSFVGFRSIIATMWAVKDGVAPNLIKQVYRHLFREPDQFPNFEDAAEALHMAVQNLRKEGVPVYSLVPFIHIGV